jgi:hypothetical protein
VEKGFSVPSSVPSPVGAKGSDSEIQGPIGREKATMCTLRVFRPLSFFASSPSNEGEPVVVFRFALLIQFCLLEIHATLNAMFYAGGKPDERGSSLTCAPFICVTAGSAPSDYRSWDEVRGRLRRVALCLSFDIEQGIR